MPFNCIPFDRIECEWVDEQVPLGLKTNHGIGICSTLLYRILILQPAIKLFVYSIWKPCTRDAISVKYIHNRSTIIKCLAK